MWPYTETWIVDHLGKAKGSVKKLVDTARLTQEMRIAEARYCKRFCSSILAYIASFGDAREMRSSDIYQNAENKLTWTLLEHIKDVIYLSSRESAARLRDLALSNSLGVRRRIASEV